MRDHRTGEDDLDSRERADEELVMYLDHDQVRSETARPVSLAPLTARTNAGLWVLRVFVIVVSVMIIYAFVASLH